MAGARCYCRAELSAFSLRAKMAARRQGRARRRVAPLRSECLWKRDKLFASRGPTRNEVESGGRLILFLVFNCHIDLISSRPFLFYIYFVLY